MIRLTDFKKMFMHITFYYVPFFFCTNFVLRYFGKITWMQFLKQIKLGYHGNQVAHKKSFFFLFMKLSGRVIQACYFKECKNVSFYTFSFKLNVSYPFFCHRNR